MHSQPATPSGWSAATHIFDYNTHALGIGTIDRPAGERSANWLPTPAGAFRPILRMYEPTPAVTDGDYELPPIRRTS